MSTHSPSMLEVILVGQKQNACIENTSVAINLIDGPQRSFVDM